MNFSQLKCYIDRSGYRKILLLGLGNEFRGDDQAGLLLAKVLKERLASDYDINLVLAGTNPENYLDKIIEFAPDVVFVVDSADMKEEPGVVRMVNRSDLDGNLFSTHAFSPGLIEDYVRSQIDCEFKYLLIQGRSFLLGQSISSEVKKSIEEFR
ncbi:MAG: hypothetical protein DRP91_00575 [Candidatus Neomarinimicrobiota bacterium]|nr:hydrogenase maturation protease [Candidatus Neomarinimicrobiota bacterium]RKY50841.1 MAG: hypothetical protein DRP91_00575 [Candidatus Neomarinimicrobiota bacterium]